MTETKIKPITVIIVEDFKLTRVGLRCALNANADIDVVAEAEDAVEGLKLIERHKPDVILMDLMMPVMDGLTATQTIRKLERKDAATVPILAMTANAFADDAKRSRQAGMNEHLSKPLDIGKVIEAIEKYRR